MMFLAPAIMMSLNGFFMLVKFDPFAWVFFVVSGLLRAEDPVLTSLPLIDAKL